MDNLKLADEKYQGEILTEYSVPDRKEMKSRDRNSKDEVLQLKL